MIPGPIQMTARNVYYTSVDCSIQKQRALT